MLPYPTRQLAPSVRINPTARRRARRFVLQAVYQWQLTKGPITMIEEQFLRQEEMVSVDTMFFQRLLSGIIARQAYLDQQLQAFLDRPVTALDQVELAILRLGAYELIDCPEIPYRIVLNEAIELAKTFGSIASHKYVNGVLHHLASQSRAMELK